MVRMFEIRLTFDDTPNVMFIGGFSEHDGYAILRDPSGNAGLDRFRIRRYPENVAKLILERLPLSLGQDAKNLIAVDLIPCEI